MWIAIPNLTSWMMLCFQKQPVACSSKKGTKCSSKKGAKRCFESLLSDSDSDSERHFAPSTIKRKAKTPVQAKKLPNGKKTLPPR